MSPEPFRWHHLIPDTGEPVFVLNRRRRLLFANRAWEALTGQTAAAARGLTCTRRASDHPLAPLLRTLSPPAEVLHGHAARVQRPQPGAAGGPPWWEIDFAPLALDGQLIVILGRIAASPPGAAVAAQPLSEARAAIRSHAAQHYGLDQPAPADLESARAFALARLAARNRVPVGLVGPPGAGKHWLARAIHHASDVRHLPFIALDCAHLPPDALRGVLFGPLGIDRPDRLGTLYLREPDALPRELQSDLSAHLVESGRTRVRLMAGFTGDPAAAMRAGRLLETLYTGLNVLTIVLPPLRERPADLPQLVETMLRRAAPVIGRTPSGLTPDAWECARAYPWPGNLRELYVTLLRAGARAAGEQIDAADLPLAVRQARAAADVPPPRPADSLPALDTLLEAVERRMIRLALERAGGNQSKAAELLSVWRPRLIRRIKALGLDADG
jgi:transcriptional regulator with PAS, ATPase and Fis domain